MNTSLALCNFIIITDFLWMTFFSFFCHENNKQTQTDAGQGTRWYIPVCCGITACVNTVIIWYISSRGRQARHHDQPRAPTECNHTARTTQPHPHTPHPINTTLTFLPASQQALDLLMVPTPAARRDGDGKKKHGPVKNRSV